MFNFMHMRALCVVLGWILCLGSSVFADAPVTSGLQLHLDASELRDASGGFLDDYDEVSTWPDLSGNDNDAESTDEPVYNSDVINGRPAVHFSGTNWMDLPNNVASLGAVNAFVVAKMTSDGYCLGSYSSGRFYLKRSSSQLSISVGDNFSYTQAMDSNFHIFQVSHIGTVVKVRMDGKLIATGTDSKTVAIPGFNLGSYNDGAGAFMRGDIAEVLVYNRELTDSERTIMQRYLMQKYGFQTLPATNDLKLHLDASELSLSNNADVLTWPDTSGNGKDADATSANDKPVYLTDVINGKPVVHFSGSSWMDLDDDTASFGAINAFVVAKMTANCFCLSSYSSGRFYIKRYDDELKSNVGSNFVFPLTLNPPFTQPLDSDFHIFQLSHIGTAVELRMDGMLIASGTDSITGTIPKFNLGSYNEGAGEFMRGDIAEVIIYDNALDDFEQAVVQEYLMKKYGFSGVPVTKGIKVCLDADSLDFSDNAYVDTWYDLSNYENDAESEGGFRPRYVAKGLNDRPTVKFAAAHWMDLPDSIVSLGAANAFILGKMTGTGYCLGSYSSARFYMLRESSKLKCCVGSAFSLDDEPLDSNFHLFQLSHIGNEVKVRMDGDIVTTGSDYNTSAVTGLNLGSYNDGAGGFMDGEIAKVLIYNRGLSDLERGVLEDYLDVQYGLSNSCAKVQFASETSSGAESTTSVSLQVNLSQASISIITVDYSATGGIAIGGGTDYTLLGSGTLTFNPGETTKNISVTINNDGDWEVDETIELTLNNVSGGNAALGLRNRHTYSILDNDTFSRNTSFDFSNYEDAASDYADAMIEYARDDYGSVSSSLFATTIDLSTMSVPVYMPPEIEGFRETDRMPTGNNIQQHQELLELLYLLDGDYADEADAALSYFFNNCQSSSTGLLAWGEHLGWDFYTEQRTKQHSINGTHEFLDDWRLWDESYALAEDGCFDFAQGLWDHQIYNQTSCTFSRHASYDSDGKSAGAEYPRHGGYFIKAWAKAYDNSSDPYFRADMLNAIENMIDSYQDRRSDAVSPVPTGGIPFSSVLLGTWVPESELELVVNAVDVKNLLPSALQTKIEDMADDTDTVYLANVSSPGGVWAQGYSSGCPYMLCLRRYNQTNNSDYRDLFIDEVDNYLATLPDMSEPIYPSAFANAIGAMIEAYSLTNDNDYLDRADYFGQMALEIFFLDSSALPQATSLQPGLYDAATGGDDLMLQLYRLSQL